MHAIVSPSIETTATAINRREAAIPPRPEGTGHPGTVLVNAHSD